ncbi:hypothetical protein [Pseudomonas sp. 2(2015)]|uniref:hypothetical protein n=1 Tax=Pseudomonas sp. 2(2015) TaxID=1619950 RepID=UPI000AFB1090|nr:hypothetical protein [Pseudomonas sp. 2(2015)]
MSSTSAIFFADEKRTRIVANTMSKVRGGLDSLRDGHDEKHKFLLEFIGQTLFHIQGSPRSFDERCIMNISVLGDRFIEEIEGFSLNKGDAEHLFVYCYRFVVEYQLSSPGEISSDLLEVLAHVSDFEFEGTIASQIRYAGHQMLINIVQHYLYHPSLIGLKSLPDAIERSEKERESIEKTLDAREGRVQALAEKLTSYETAFNFVGLYAGFKSMKAAKVSERRWNFFYLLLIGLLLLLPFIAKIVFILKGSPEIKLDYVGLATLAGLELLLLYFFRVALQNFKSVKAQLLQIDLRMTLCQFVQSYAEYSKEARTGSPGLLERFEQVVFSGIVNDEGAIPSTFDGLDKLAELVGKIRK